MSNDIAVDIVVDWAIGESVQSAVQELVWKHTRDLTSPPDGITLNCWAVWTDDAFDPQRISDLALPFFIDKHGRVMLDDNVNRATGFRGVDEHCHDLVAHYLQDCDLHYLSFDIELDFNDERDKDMFNPELRIMLDPEIHILNDNKRRDS